MARKIGVLIVDDSLTIRAMLEQILTNDPEINVIGTAADAEEAWEMLTEERPDVLTLDISLPGLDGLRFLSDVMARCPTPVVMVSGSTAPGRNEREEALRRGAVACFGKNHITSASSALATLIKQAGRNRARSALRQGRTAELAALSYGTSFTLTDYRLSGRPPA